MSSGIKKVRVLSNEEHWTIYDKWARLIDLSRSSWDDDFRRYPSSEFWRFEITIYSNKSFLLLKVDCSKRDIWGNTDELRADIVITLPPPEDWYSQLLELQLKSRRIEHPIYADYRNPLYLCKLRDFYSGSDIWGTIEAYVGLCSKQYNWAHLFFIENVEHRQQYLSQMGYKEFIRQAKEHGYLKRRHREWMTGQELLEVKPVSWIARKVEEDYFGTTRKITTWDPWVFVSVLDATHPEKRYLLRVPPEMRTVKEAIAWTFKMYKDQYKPVVET